MTPERLEEERRLMYVGITRARSTLAVSTLRRRKRGRETVVGVPSRFIAEMKLNENARQGRPAREAQGLARRLGAAREQAAPGGRTRTVRARGAGLVPAPGRSSSAPAAPIAMGAAARVGSVGGERAGRGRARRDGGFTSSGRRHERSEDAGLRRGGAAPPARRARRRQTRAHRAGAARTASAGCALRSTAPAGDRPRRGLAGLAGAAGRGRAPGRRRADHAGRPPAHAEPAHRAPGCARGAGSAQRCRAPGRAAGRAGRDGAGRPAHGRADRAATRGEPAALRQRGALLNRVSVQQESLWENATYVARSTPR